MAAARKTRQTKKTPDRLSKKSSIPKNATQRGRIPKPSQGTTDKTCRVKESGPGTPPGLRPKDQVGFPIIGIGASAGGLEAFEEFFMKMPADSGVGFVVVSHQSPGRTSLLPGLLQKYTDMPVVEVTQGLVVRPNTVYLAVAGKNLAIFNGMLQLMELDSHERVSLPIDYFFRSLAMDQKHRAIGIILSGTGSDGTLGVKAIKGESGMTIAQKPRSAKYAGMPESAIASGSIDYVCRAMEMPARILTYIQGPYLNPVALSGELPKEQGSFLNKVFVLLRDRTGNDFSLYKSNTISRRIERRMNVHHIESSSHYLQYLLTNPYEVDALFQEILIGVTSFFRDPPAFEVLVAQGLPLLLDDKQDGESVRVWVPGCGTGEEAYSLAMVMQEYMVRRKVRFQVQVFGTDLDAQAIEIARKGMYPAGIANDVTSERLTRFFSKEDSHYRVKKDIRDMVIFAPHNVLADPPFTKLDLLSCRNLLIYLEARTQRHLFPLFHYALKSNGLLFLGSSETIGEFEENLFDTVDRKWKLYRRKTGSTNRTTLQRFPLSQTQGARDLPLSEEGSAPSPAPSISALIEALLLEQYAPASVIVNERGEVVYIHGRTGTYLEPAPGQPNLILLNMAREGLRYDLAAALHQVTLQNAQIVRRGVQVKTNGAFLPVDLTVKRIEEPEALRGLYQVTFEAKPQVAADSKKKGRSGKPEGEPMPGVLEELRYTKQRLQHTNEELQTSNEELKSTNEELQSTNEELQSTNEELETSKEELQSLNEELVTVNAELQGKIDELSDINDDLHNLLNSIEVATIFLDNDLNIKRFTPAAKRVINLIATDVGRPLADIVSKLLDPHLIQRAQEVLRTLVYQEAEVQSMDAQWYLLRILPYRTARNVIDGLVITFLNVTGVKQAEIVASEAQELAESIIQMVHEPLMVLNEHLRVETTNQAFCQMFHLVGSHLEGQLLYEVGEGEWNNSDLRRLLEEILPENRAFENFQFVANFPHVGRRMLALNARRLERGKSKPRLILLTMEDVTNRTANSNG